jgi:hypothetical protein
VFTGLGLCNRASAVCRRWIQCQMNVVQRMDGLRGHTLTTANTLMGTAAGIDNIYPKSSQATGLECVVHHYLMSLCR